MEFLFGVCANFTFFLLALCILSPTAVCAIWAIGKSVIPVHIIRIQSAAAAAAASAAVCCLYRCCCCYKQQRCCFLLPAAVIVVAASSSATASFCLLFVIVRRTSKFGAGSLNWSQCFLSLHSNATFFYVLGSIFSQLRSRFAFIPTFWVNCGHARSRGGRQPPTTPLPHEWIILIVW